MFVNSQRNTKKILTSNANTSEANLSTKSKALENKYQCIVCEMDKASLSDLHWHQTYQHSSEELSLSVIGSKGLVKIVGPPLPQEKENSQRSIWSSFAKKPSEFYYLSSSILGINEVQKSNLKAPVSLVLTKDKNLEEDIKNFSQVEKREPVVLLDKLDMSAYEKWEKELNWMREISMEDFIKNANELCNDLIEFKHISVSKKIMKNRNA